MKISHLIPRLRHYTSPSLAGTSLGAPSHAHNWVFVTRHRRYGVRFVNGHASWEKLAEPMTITRQFSFNLIAMNRGIECPTCHWNTDEHSARTGSSDQYIYDTHRHFCHSVPDDIINGEKEATQ